MISSRVPKNPKYSKRDIAVGTKTEFEHTKDRHQARTIAIQHLNEHPTYYRVLPMAEQFMSIQENKALPKPRHRRRSVPARHPYIPGLPAWGNPAF